jgi:hypothetical protein
MSRSNTSKPIVQKFGWRIPEFCEATGFRRAKINQLIKDRVLASSKVDGARIITTHPADFLAGYSQE